MRLGLPYSMAHGRVCAYQFVNLLSRIGGYREKGGVLMDVFINFSVAWAL